MDKVYIHTEDIHNFSAALEVVPHIMDSINPQSVLDVGCGIGTWLKIFEQHLVADLMGIDGDYVDRSLMKISPDKFKSIDLKNRWSLNRKFDLVISLEVAEHLPEESADVFVESLVDHGDVILFSAAIPGQDGQYHLNEQWPSYWQQKFLKHGYYFHDVIRPVIWNNENVDWWYRQNAFIVNRSKPEHGVVLDLVHPKCFEQRLNNFQRNYDKALGGDMPLSSGFKIFIKSLAKALKLR